MTSLLLLFMAAITVVEAGGLTAEWTPLDQLAEGRNAGFLSEDGNSLFDRVRRAPLDLPAGRTLEVGVWSPSEAFKTDYQNDPAQKAACLTERQLFPFWPLCIVRDKCKGVNYIKDLGPNGYLGKFTCQNSHTSLGSCTDTCTGHGCNCDYSHPCYEEPELGKDVANITTQINLINFYGCYNFDGCYNVNADPEISKFPFWRQQLSFKLDVLGENLVDLDWQISLNECSQTKNYNIWLTKTVSKTCEVGNTECLFLYKFDYYDWIVLRKNNPCEQTTIPDSCTSSIAIGEKNCAFVNSYCTQHSTCTNTEGDVRNILNLKPDLDACHNKVYDSSCYGEIVKFDPINANPTKADCKDGCCTVNDDCGNNKKICAALHMGYFFDAATLRYFESLSTCPFVLTGLCDLDSTTCDFINTCTMRLLDPKPNCNRTATSYSCTTNNITNDCVPDQWKFEQKNLSAPYLDCSDDNFKGCILKTACAPDITYLCKDAAEPELQLDDYKKKCKLIRQLQARHHRPLSTQQRQWKLCFP